MSRNSFQNRTPRPTHARLTPWVWGDPELARHAYARVLLAARPARAMIYIPQRPCFLKLSSSSVPPKH